MPAGLARPRACVFLIASPFHEPRVNTAVNANRRTADAAQAARTAGILLFLAALAALATFDAAMKQLLQTYPAPFLNVMRYSTVCLIAVVLTARHRRPLRDYAPAAHRKLLLARGMVLGSVGTCFMTALLWMPLSEATAIYFMSPLMVVALSPWLLGERVGRVQWLAVTVGFAGMLLVVRPGGDLPWLGTVLMGVAAVSYALFLVFTRKLAGKVPPDVQYVTTALICLIVTAIPAPFFLPDLWPDAVGLLQIVGVCALNAIGQILLIAAMQRAEASTLAPFNYCHLLMAVAFSTFWFGRPPDTVALCGMALIVAAGVFLAVRRPAAGAPQPAPHSRPADAGHHRGGSPS